MPAAITKITCAGSGKPSGSSIAFTDVMSCTVDIDELDARNDRVDRDPRADDARLSEAVRDARPDHEAERRGRYAEDRGHLAQRPVDDEGDLADEPDRHHRIAKCVLGDEAAEECPGGTCEGLDWAEQD